MTDLAKLPAPSVIEPLDYESILAALIADFRQRYPDYTAILESDPAVKILEVAAYRELLLRARINDAARANLLAYSSGSDLDHLAAFYGVERLSGEADSALRERVRARIAGWANAGGAAHYRYWALSASADVQDIGVVSPLPGVVRLCVLAREGADEAATIEAVRAQVMREDVRVLTDTVEVVGAVIRDVVVEARIVRLPTTPPSALPPLAEAVLSEARAAMRLGWDLTRSWLIARLHRAGVYRVDLLAPLDDIACAPHEAVRVVDVRLTDGGVNA